jgi:Fe-S cluster assembly iron-binding protein IscA
MTIKNKIYHIPYFTNSKQNNILKSFSRYNIIKIIIFITYFNTATGYGNYRYSKTLPYKDIIFSSNGYSKMYDYNNLNYIQDINIYKYNKHINKSFLFINENEKDDLTYILYVKTYIITIIILIIFIILLIILSKIVFRIITNKV